MDEYTVTFTFTDRRGKTDLVTSKFPTELAAVRHISHVERMENQEIVSFSGNIDRSKFQA